MENAVDALKMGAAILVFIIAIGTSFSLFGTAKETADSIITMRDKQAYLQAAEVDNGILYTSTESITSGGNPDFTIEGYRIVKVDDVISTIYRYSKEKYGVTIIKKSTGNVLARFDSATEAIMNKWNEIDDDNKDNYTEQLKKSIATEYVQNVNLNLEELYELNGSKVGAPWYGNDKQIQERINKDLSGGTYSYNGQTYEGKKLIEDLNGNTIIEITNEIDNSKYVENNGEITNLLQNYNMPTVEVVYIVE